MATITDEHPSKKSIFFSSTGFKSFAGVAALILVLSWVRLSPQSNNAPGAQSAGPQEVAGEVAPGEQTTTEGGGPAAAGGGAKSGGAAAQTGPGAKSLAGLECKAGKNGGATDTGVLASRIRLASTAVLDGPAKSLLEDSPVAMKAVMDKVNKAGGICGRLLDLKVDNDSFRADTGLTIIKNYIAEGYFALPVVPSAEGLGSAILAGEIAKAKIPVVGTDGMRKEQYGDPYVWPVAAATVTSMRVMAKYGYQNRNARSFAIIYDSKYKFGAEGAQAFREQVAAMPGCAAPAGQGPEKSPCIKADVALDPDLPSYGSDILQFNGTSGCGGDPGRCDMVAMLLLPDTAIKWLKGQPVRARLYISGAQTLFTDGFANGCVQFYTSGCDGFAVWTGYNPPIGPLASLPGVAAYVNDVKSVKSQIDVTNQFVEGAYLGMTVFVEALKRVGPGLTRDRLKGVLDSMTYASDFSSPLTWKPGNHSANVRAQSFEMTASGGTFRGWRSEGSSFQLDPAFGG